MQISNKTLFIKFYIFFLFIFLFIPQAVFAATYANSDVPLIFPREYWESDVRVNKLLDWLPEDKNYTDVSDQNLNSKDAIPDYAPVERIIIHDTGCNPKNPRCNGNEASGRDLVRSIYRNHALIRGWGDMGYHYIVDRQGNIYEGRFGGNGVRGAHVYDKKTCRNFNVGTIGIALLGNYEHTAPTRASMESLSQLVGWLSATNGINPVNIAKTSTLWTNPRVDGVCNTDYGSFSQSFTGPVVLGHKDIEKANTDPGIVDLVSLRTQGQRWKEIYATYAYKERGNAQVIRIDGGVVKNASEGGYNKVVQINKNQLEMFPVQNRVLLPDGTLIKSRSRGDIYKIEAGKRRHITSAILFQNLGYSLGNVRIISDRELLGYAAGEPIIYQDGTLLRSQKTNRIYLIKNKQRRYVLSEKALKQNELFGKKIISVPSVDIEVYPKGGVLGLPEGTLVSTGRSAFVPNYMIIGGGKKLIPSWNMFKRWQLNWRKIKIISKTEFNKYPDKGELPYPNGTLIRQAAYPKMYLVHQGKKHWITTYKTFQTLGLKLTQAIQLTAKQMTAYALGVSVLIPDDWQYIKNGQTPAVVQSKSIRIKQNNTTPQALPSVQRITQIITPQTIPSQKTNQPSIRIGIASYSKTDRISITSTGAFTVKTRNGETIYRAGETANLVWVDAEDVVVTQNISTAIFTVVNYQSYNWNDTVNFNQFRGTLELTYSPVSKKVWLVNELPFEQYLLGMAEAINTDHPEYQKAFSIASRSYALFHLQNNGKRGKEEIYHLNNTPSDQVYKGYRWETYAPNLPVAARATQGQIMQYNEKVARAVYSSDSGGVTRNACNYFRGVFCTSDYGYLIGGVKDPIGTKRRSAKVQSDSHGVGMSAAGARYLAETGKTYQEILKYYYKGITFKKVY